MIRFFNSVTRFFPSPITITNIWLASVLAPEKIIYHPVGIDTTRFRYKWENPEPLPLNPIKLITVGRLIDLKGLEYSIKAVSQVARKHPELKMVYDIIGEGPLRGDLKSLINETRLNHVVTLCGEKTQDQVAGALESSHLFILPSTAEALPVVIMEAQQSGLPVLTTTVGSTDKLVLNESSGFLVPPRDIDALADRLEYLLMHPEAWPRMGRIAEITSWRIMTTTV